MRALTLDDVPAVVTFVDEDDRPLPGYGELKLDLPARALVLEKARRSHQSIDTTLHRMVTAAIRAFIRASKEKRRA